MTDLEARETIEKYDYLKGQIVEGKSINGLIMVPYPPTLEDIVNVAHLLIRRRSVTTLRQNPSNMTVLVLFDLHLWKQDNLIDWKTLNEVLELLNLSQ